MRRTRTRARLATNLLFLSSAWIPLATAAASPKVVSMPFSRRHDAYSIDKIKRDTITADLGNGQQDVSSLGIYYINTTIGTPGQTIQLQLDTGSSDLWMFSTEACQRRQSRCYGGVFNSSESSTFETIFPGEFNISYVTPGSNVHGDYFSDNVRMANTEVVGLTMGLALRARNVAIGIMGIGYRQNEAIFAQTGGRVSYPNIIDLMVNQSLINTRAYSLFLDDKDAATGTILFGGYDTAKFDGDLALLQIQPDINGIISSFIVAWTGISITTESSGEVPLTDTDFDLPVYLDSGTTLTYLPSRIANQILSAARAIYDRSNDIYLVDCDLVTTNATINYKFGGTNGPTIRVPLRELVLSVGDPILANGLEYCVFGIKPATRNILLFGDTFLRSAYVVYDLDSATIGIAQANTLATDSNIVEIPAGGSIVSRASSVVGQPTATVTASRNGGEIDGFGTGIATSGLTAPTEDSNPGFTLAAGPGSTGTASPNSAVGVAPAADWALGVIAGSLALALCSGGLFIIF